MDKDDLFGDWDFQIYAINLEVDTANNDINMYIKTHYPSYPKTKIVVDKKNIEKQIRDIFKLGIKKYVKYIKDKHATSPNDFEDFPNMIKKIRIF